MPLIVRPSAGHLSDTFAQHAARYPGRVARGDYSYCGQDFGWDDADDWQLVAPNSGIADVRYDADYGHHIVILGGTEWETLTAHLDEVYISSGTRVRAGQSIGLMGSTGNTKGRHTHLELRIRGVQVDPMQYMTTLAALEASELTEPEEDEMIQPLNTRVIRNTKTGDIVMLHPTGIAMIGTELIPDIPSANGQALMAGQPINEAGYYWIDLPDDRFGWELSRHKQLLDMFNAHIRSLAAGGSSHDISDDVAKLIPTPAQIADELAKRLAE